MGYLWQGAGVKEQAASETAVKVPVSSDAGDYAYECSVSNTGSSYVHVRLNTETADFDADTAIPVAPGTMYTWASSEDQEAGRKIYSICIGCAAGETTSVDIAFN